MLFYTNFVPLFILFFQFKTETVIKFLLTGRIILYLFIVFTRCTLIRVVQGEEISANTIGY